MSAFMTGKTLWTTFVNAKILYMVFWFPATNAVLLRVDSFCEIQVHWYKIKQNQNSERKRKTDFFFFCGEGTNKWLRCCIYLGWWFTFKYFHTWQTTQPNQRSFCNAHLWERAGQNPVGDSGCLLTILN